MNISILSIFPGVFTDFLAVSMIGKAVEDGILTVNLINIRDYAHDKHKTTDDYPYGGGPGMIMKPEPLYEAIQDVRRDREIPVIYFTPQGRLLHQSIINAYSESTELILLCGHYKEIDQRIRDLLITDEISIGDYVLSGGELPAMIFVDAVTRLLPGVLNDLESALSDSHQTGLLGCPHYTRPPEFMGIKVPDVLLSGNHEKIASWRRQKALEITRKNRPDLLKDE
ncbi:MAG: tRNA (guanosine(37)-N1)-methyltransferase TrmD [Candidatus Cloacimonetes bacterium]|nr:tRNA (guanosine(37)-N1)-methyltransferase TrmD [Candidatus Cloacimonadota bacterium]